MLTALLTASYIDGSGRLERIKRFVKWHNQDQSRLKADGFYLSDNGSNESYVNWLTANSYYCIPLRYTDSLIRGPGPFDYPYCWRHLYTIKILIQLGYEKIIFMDSDCYVVSERLAKHIRDLKSGWEAFWIEKYQFPSAELHVLCKDAFPIFEKFTSVPYTEHVGKLMEAALPFTKVNRDFKVDRWGEANTPQEEWMDAYCQALPHHPLQFFP